MKKLPLRIQTFREIMEDDYLDVDKTKNLVQLVTESEFYFLSRPRRFGKSLFLNTLEEIFKGNKELFKKCKIYESDYKWEKHPVLYPFQFKLTQIG